MYPYNRAVILGFPVDRKLLNLSAVRLDLIAVVVKKLRSVCTCNRRIGINFLQRIIRFFQFVQSVFDCLLIS